MAITEKTRDALYAILREAYAAPDQCAYAMVLGEEVQCRIGRASRGFGRVYWKLNGDRFSDRSLQRHLAWLERPAP